MQSKIMLAATAAAAATGALAIDLSGKFPQAFRRAELDARNEAECLSAYSANSGILGDFPTMPNALATFTDVDVPAITDPCVFPSITGSAGAIITSYSSALQSWQDAHITEIRSIYQACDDVPEFSSVLAQVGDAICSTAAAAITSADGDNATATRVTATATASGDATGDASGSGSAASTTASPAAAPKETGLFFAAAAAAAGIAGVVML